MTDDRADWEESTLWYTDRFPQDAPGPNTQDRPITTIITKSLTSLFILGSYFLGTKGKNYNFSNALRTILKGSILDGWFPQVLSEIFLALIRHLSHLSNDPREK